MASELAGKTTAKVATATATVAEPVTRAYVTFPAGDDGECWKVVVRLAKDLRKVAAAYPLVVAVLPDVPESHRSILVSQGCIVREIEPVYPPENQAQFAMASSYVVNYSKLRIWEFVEYERMVYLDAGIQVLENIDMLFELEEEHFYAATDGFCDEKMSHTPQYKISFCKQCADKVGWPPAPYFKTGVFLHEPSMATAKALMDTLRVTPPACFADRPGEENLPPFGSRLTTKLAVFARGNVPALATLAASSAAVGVVTSAANPAICFGFYALLIAAVVAIMFSLRGI
ncbi:galactinol synthase 1-like [Phragmites australis]|uniref:galactinol synthase 1-like n=1 Tax=Phragmites australis TaxID=29695 RepID=UPI002D793589|nr:galactinol synthase 1-like [Phragmites australis]